MSRSQNAGGQGAPPACTDKVAQVAFDDSWAGSTICDQRRVIDFIQTQRFDMSDSEQLERKYQLTHPDMARTLEKTVHYVKDQFLH